MTLGQVQPSHLVFVRHAQALQTREGTQAASDIGLTELGWRQAQAVAEWLVASYHVDAVVTGESLRARQTAEIIAGRVGIALSLHEGLEEATTAYWDELPYRLAHPLAGCDSPWRPDPVSSPRYASFTGQLQNSVARLLEKHPGETVVAVSHGSAVSTILRCLFGGHHIAIHTENTGVTELTWETDHWRLNYHNSTAHLSALVAAGRRQADRPAYTPAPYSGSAQINGTAASVTEQSQKVALAGPHAGAQMSERDVKELLRLARPRPEDRVLDVGTGFGGLALAFAPHVSRVLGVDLSPAMLEQAETARLQHGAANVRFRLGDILAIALAERSFDLILCHDVIHFARDTQKLLTRLRGLLAPGGRLLIDQLVGNDDPVKRATQNAIELQRDPSLVAVPSAGDVERVLAATGLRVEQAERYTVTRDVEEWLGQAAADEAARGTVRSMIEAGLEADSAGLNARRTRDGRLQIVQARVRLLALPAEQAT